MLASKGPPVISVVGWSNSGKTTFLTKLVRELKARGYRVGTVKHHHGDVEFDKPGKDTWQHSRAGADAVSLAGKCGFFVYKKCENPSLDDVSSLMPEMDIIITEGFKSENTPKIEVRRRHQQESSPAAAAEELIALVEETSVIKQTDGETVPCFAPGDAGGVADLLETLYLR